MRVARFVFSVSISIFLSVSVAAQQTATSSPQALQLLRRSAAALSGGQSLTNVTLSGTARRIAGSDDDTGTAVFKALASGASRVDLSLSSGQRTEIHDLSKAEPAGAWSGPDRVSHSIALHNLFSEPAWFFPAFAIVRRLSGPAYVVIYVGQETHEGQMVEHVSVSQTPARPNRRSGVSFGHLTQIDFFLDPNTLLPVAIAFNTHPDDNALVDIPFEVRFSDYRPLSGAQVPFHVQKYLNNTLILDFQADAVTFNAGLSAADFNLP